MPITASQLVAMVSVSGATQATQALLGVGAASTSAGDKLKSLTFAGVAIAGAAIVDLGAKAVSMAGNFQEGMTQLVTGAGESQKNLKLVSDGILSMATQTGNSTKELSDGMYMIESAGYHGAQGLDVLKAAAEGAKVGNASLADVANGVTTAMTDFASTNLTAAQATNDMIATVAAGKTHMGDLARSFSNILPVASAVHASFYDVSAAMATMTGEGTSAQLASTYLKQVLLALEVPSKGAVKALASIGLTSKEVAADMQKSLPDTLKMITDAIGKKFPEGSAQYVEAIKAISGGSKNMMAMLELTGSHMATFQGNLASITDAVKKGGSAITGWNLVQEDFNQKMSQAREVLETLGIKVGTVLIPVVSKLFDAVTPLVTRFSDWLDKSGALQQATNALSGGLQEVSSAFDAISKPVEKATKAIAPAAQEFNQAFTYAAAGLGPVTDITDRLNKVFTKTPTVMTPITDITERLNKVFPQTKSATSDVVDVTDRLNQVFPKTTDGLKKTTDAANPLTKTFGELKDIFFDVDKTVTVLVGDAATFVGGLASAANQSDVFQAVLQSVHDILPDVGNFLTTVGTDVNQNLLPPLESLVTNVGKAVGNFATWLDKSGTAKEVLSDLGTVFGITSQAVGTLVGWVADLVGWLGGGGAGTTTLLVTLGLVGAAFVGLKLANTIAGFGQMFSDLQAGEGIVANLAGSLKTKLSKAYDDFLANQAPNLKKSLDDTKNAASDAAVAEEKVGTAATEEMATGVEAGATEAETSLVGVETQAEATGVSVESIGTDAATSASEVAASSIEMDANLEGTSAVAEGTSASVKGIGESTTVASATTDSATTAMKGAFAGLAGGVAAASLIIAGAIAGAGLMIWNTVNSIQMFLDKYKQDQGEFTTWWKAEWGKLPPAAQVATDILTNGVSTKVGEMKDNVTTSVKTMSKDVVATLTDMQKSSIDQGAQISTGMQNLFATMQAQASDTFGKMSDDAYGYLKDVENYVSQAQQKALQSQIGKNSGNILNKNFGGFAEGGDVSKTDFYKVGERGPEIVQLAAGSHVYPHGVIPPDLMSIPSSGMNGSGGSSTSTPLQINLSLDGKMLASVMVDHLGEAMARQSRLRYARRAYG